MLSLTILLARQFVFDDFCQLASHPCSSSLWPSELGVQAQLVNGSFSHIRAGTVTFQWEFYKLSCMPKVHKVAYLSILFPLHWPFSAGYFLSVYLKFLLDRLFEDGMVGDVVFSAKFSQKGSEGFVNEVGSSIAYYHSWRSKAREDHFMKHLPCVPGINSSTW